MLAGIDLGGTKIEGILLSDSGQELFRRRIPTPQGQYRAIIAAICELHAQIEHEASKRLPLGIGTPGSISPASGLMRNSNSTCLNGRPFLTDLQNQLQRPVRMANDADCFALSEATDGAGQSAASVFGVIIGTGTGGGIVIRGQLLSGRNGIAGEWGHNPLPWPARDEYPGPACYCGKRGCIETFLSGAGLSRLYAQLSGQKISAFEIAQKAEQGERRAQQSIEQYSHRLAKALASIINIIDPQVIILGGGLGQITALYEQVPYHWSDYIFSDTVQTRLLPPVHGDSSGVRGAAWLWRGQS